MAGKSLRGAAAPEPESAGRAADEDPKEKLIIVMKKVAAAVSRWAVIILAFELKRTLVTPPQPGILYPAGPPNQHSIQRLAFDAKLRELASGVSEVE